MNAIKNLRTDTFIRDRSSDMKTISTILSRNISKTILICIKCIKCINSKLKILVDLSILVKTFVIWDSLVIWEFELDANFVYKKTCFASS